jgi:hypothetical protein
MARGWPDFHAVRTEVLGAESAYGAASRQRDAREVILRLVVEHGDAKPLEVFARELGSVGLSFAQGTTGLLGGRPKPAPVVRLFTFLIDKARLGPATVQIGAQAPFEVVAPAVAVPPLPPTPPEPRQAAVPMATAPGAAATPGAMIELPLMRVAHARSGDKGDASNIAIFCRRPEYMDHLATVLTPERIAAHFAGLVDGPVTRYEAPGLSAFNFVLDNALGGGGMASLRLDAQGKAYGQRALELRVRVPAAWLA